MIAFLVTVATADPAACPQIERRPVVAYAEVPRAIRDWEGPMAEPGEAWNSSDAIDRSDGLGLAAFVAAGDMGGGRWLVVHESAGRKLFRHVDVWTVSAQGAVTGHPVSLTGGDLGKLCAEAARKLAD